MTAGKFSIEGVLNKIKSGDEVSDAEINYIDDQLKTNPTAQAIQAFALTHDPTDENVLRLLAFWNERVDDYICGHAIAAICGRNGWELADKFIEKLIDYSSADRYESQGISVVYSLSSLNWYLHNTQDPVVYEILLNRLLTLPVAEKGISSRYSNDGYANLLFAALLYGITGHDDLTYRHIYHKNRESEDEVLDMVRSKIKRVS